MNLELLLECIRKKWKNMDAIGPAEETAREILWMVKDVLEDYCKAVWDRTAATSAPPKASEKA